MAGWKRFFQNLGMNAARTAAEESPVADALSTFVDKEGNPVDSYSVKPVGKTKLALTVIVKADDFIAMVNKQKLNR